MVSVGVIAFSGGVGWVLSIIHGTGRYGSVHDDEVTAGMERLPDSVSVYCFWHFCEGAINVMVCVWVMCMYLTYVCDEFISNTEACLSLQL